MSECPASAASPSLTASPSTSTEHAAQEACGQKGEKRVWTAALLVIGDEILSGRTQERNVAEVALWLNTQGIRLNEVRIVGDRHEAIISAVRALSAAHDYLFTTGGIGPTHDDITVDAIAQALNVPVTIHPEARAMLERWYAMRGGLTDARLRMARVPEGATLIPNPLSGAPGICLGRIHILAGVPAIAAAQIKSLDGKLEGGDPLLSRTIGCWVAESEIAELLESIERRFFPISIGSYPFRHGERHGANFVLRGTDAERLHNAAAALEAALANRELSPVPNGINGNS